MTLQDRLDLEANSKSVLAESADLDTTLGNAVGNRELESSIYRNTIRPIAKTLDAFGNDGSVEDSQIQDLNSRQAGTEILSGDELASSGLAELANASVGFGVGRAAGVGAVLAGKSTIAGAKAVAQQALIKTAASKSSLMLNSGLKAAAKTKVMTQLGQKGAAVGKKLQHGDSKLLESSAGAMGGELLSSQIDAPMEYMDERTGGRNYKITDESQLTAFLTNFALSAGMELTYRGGMKVYDNGKISEARANFSDNGIDKILTLDSEAIQGINTENKVSGVGSNGFKLVKDASKADKAGAYVDSNMNFSVQTPFLGTLKGKLDVDQSTGEVTMVIDDKLSSPTDEAFTSQYKSVGGDTGGIIAMLKQNKTRQTQTASTAQPYTAGSGLTYDAEGNLVATKEMVDFISAQHGEIVQDMNMETKTAFINEEIKQTRADKNYQGVLPTEITESIRATNKAQKSAVGYKPTRLTENHSQTSTGVALSTGTPTLLNGKTDIIAGLLGRFRAIIGGKPTASSFAKNYMTQKYTSKTTGLTEVPHIMNNGDMKSADPMIDEVYDTKEIEPTASTDSYLKITDVKKHTVDAIRNAIDIAVAKADSVVIKADRNGTPIEVMTQKAKDGLPQAAGKITADLLGLKPDNGTNSTVLESIIGEYANIAEEMINSDITILNEIPEKDMPVKHKNDLSGYGMNSEQLALKHELERGGKTASEGWSEISRDLSISTKPEPIIVSKINPTEAKIKSEALSEGDIVEALAKKMTSLDFEVDPKGLQELQALLDSKTTQEDIMVLLNGGESLDDLSATIIEGLKQDASLFEISMNELNTLIKNTKKKNGNIRFPVRTLTNNRVMFDAVFSPHSSKLYRRVLGVVDTATTDVSTDAGMEQAMRHTLMLLDAKNAKGEKIPKIATYAEVKEMFNAEMKSIREMLAEAVDKAKANRVALDIADPAEFQKYVLYQMDIAKLKYAASKEGLESSIAIQQMFDINQYISKKGNPKLKIVGEIDGTNQGPSIVSLFAGIFKDESTGVGTTDGILRGNDMYEVLQDVVKLSKGSSGYSSSLIETFIHDLKRKDVKYPVIGKAYGSGAGGIARQLGDYIVQKVLKNIHNYSDPKSVALHERFMGVLNGYSQNHPQIVKYENKLNDIRGANNKLQDMLVDAPEDVDAIKVQENVIRGLEGELSNIDKSFIGGFEYQNGINYNLVAEAQVKLEGEAQARQIGDIESSYFVLTPDELEAVQLAITRDVSEVVDYSFEEMYSKSVNEPMYNFKQAFEKFTKHEFENFAISYTSKMSFRTEQDITKAVDEIVSVISKDAENTTVDARKIHDELGEGQKSYSDMFDAVVKAGYSPKSLMSNWTRFAKIVPTIDTHFGSKVVLLKIDSGMGLAETSQGKAINVGSIGFRMINDPLVAIGTDSGLMGASIGDNQMSLFDAFWGGSNIVDSAKSSNSNLADVAMNYNIYKQMEQSMRNSSNRTSGVVIDPDASFFMARSSGAEANFMEVKDDFETQLRNRTDSDHAQTQATIDEVHAEAINLQAKQEATGTLAMSNAANGMDTVVGKATHTPYTLDVDVSSYSTVAEINTKQWNNIPVRDKASTRVDSLKLRNVSGTTGKMSTLTKLAFGNSATYNNNIITLAGKEFNTKNFIQALHEIGHKVESLNESGEISQLINKYLRSRKARLVFVDQTTGQMVSSVSPTNSEVVSNLTESLMYNELLMNNDVALANSLFGGLAKDGYIDISKELNKQYMVMPDDTKVHTFSQMMEYVADVERNNQLNKELLDFYDSFHTVINTSNEIKNWINGYEFGEFSTTLKNTPKKIHDTYNASYKENKKAFIDNLIKQSSTVGNLFYLDMSTEGIAMMAARASGADAIHSKLISGYHDEVVDEIKKIAINFGKTTKEVDNDLGIMIAAGMQHLAPYLKMTDYQTFKTALTELDFKANNFKLPSDLIASIAEDQDLTFRGANTHKALGRKLSGLVNDIVYGNAFKGNLTTLDVAAEMLQMIDKATGTRGDARLANNKTMIDNYAAKLDAWVAGARARGEGMILGDKMKSVFEDYFSKGKDNDSIKGFLETWKQDETRLKQSNMYNGQFGLNPKQIFKTDSYKLSLNGIEKNRAGTINVAGSQVPIYLIGTDELTVMTQQSVIANPKISEFEKSKAKIDLGVIKQDENGRYVEVDGQRIDLPGTSEKAVGNRIDGRITPDLLMRAQLRGEANAAMDYSYSTQATRNTSMIEAEGIRREALNHQIQIGIETGVLLTREQYLEQNNKDQYNKLGEPLALDDTKLPIDNNNAWITDNFGEFYYEKRHTVDLEGTKGANLGKMLHQNFGPGAAKAMTEFLKLAISARDILKTTTLMWNAGSWINSAVSSMTIYMTHADGAHMLRDKRLAKEAQKDFDTKFKALSVAVRSRDQASIATAKEALESTELYEAMKFGMSDTIRKDAYTNQTYKDVPIYATIDAITGGKGASDLIKQFQLDPSTKAGSTVGHYFDRLEVTPKMMLYFNKKQSGMSAQQAATYTTMANPQYARNLSPIWNVVDQFSPYTKYFVSYPMMLRYAGHQKMGKLLAILAVSKGLTMLSWYAGDKELTSEEKKLASDGYMRIPGTNWAKYMGSMNNYYLPSKSFGSYTVADFGFVPDGIERLAMPMNPNPFRKINTKAIVEPKED